MAGTIHLIELVEKLKAPSHLIVPPLAWNRSGVASAMHLCSLMRSLGREAFILGNEDWRPQMPAGWPEDYFVFVPAESGDMALAKRPDWVWLWGLAQALEHTPRLKDFLMGCDVIQVLDWTQKGARRIGDFVCQTHLLGGLGELCHSLAREVPAAVATGAYLSTAMESFVNQYAFATRDTPLIHMLNQLHAPEGFHSIPEVEPAAVVEKAGWKIFAYAGLDAQQAEMLRCSALDTYARCDAEHALFVYEIRPGDVFVNIVSPRMDYEFSLRQTLVEQLPLNLDGSFKLASLDVLASFLPASGEPIRDLKLTPWPRATYGGHAFSILCDDPAWVFERERRLEALREPQAGQDEEQPAQEAVELPQLHWDAGELLQRVRRLNDEQQRSKPPRIVLTHHDLRSHHELMHRIREQDLREAWDGEELEQLGLLRLSGLAAQLQVRRQLEQEEFHRAETDWRAEQDRLAEARAREAAELLQAMELERQRQQDELAVQEFLQLGAAANVSEEAMVVDTATDAVASNPTDHATVAVDPAPVAAQVVPAISVSNNEQPDAAIAEAPAQMDEVEKILAIREPAEEPTPEQAEPMPADLESSNAHAEDRLYCAESTQHTNTYNNEHPDSAVAEVPAQVDEVEEFLGARETAEDQSALHEFLSIENDTSAIHEALDPESFATQNAPDLESDPEPPSQGPSFPLVLPEQLGLERDPQAIHVPEHTMAEYVTSEIERPTPAEILELLGPPPAAHADLPPPIPPPDDVIAEEQELHEILSLEDHAEHIHHEEHKGEWSALPQAGPIAVSTPDPLPAPQGESLEFPTYEEYLAATAHDSESEHFDLDEAQPESAGEPAQPPTAALLAIESPDSQIETDPSPIAAPAQHAPLQPALAPEASITSTYADIQKSEIRDINTPAHAGISAPERRSLSENPYLWDGRNIEHDIIASIRNAARLHKADLIYALGFILLLVYIALGR